MFFNSPFHFTNFALNTDYFAVWNKSLYLLALLMFPFLAYSQEGCFSVADRTTTPDENGWVGHVYQFPIDTVSYPNVNIFPTGGEYKGMLSNDYLPKDSINFDTRFGGNIKSTDFPYDDDQLIDLTGGGCLTRLSFFGVVFKGKYIIPDTGTYEITIASDDGARLKVDGQIIHNLWGLTTYNPANIRKYYIFRSAGQVLDLEMLYYENTRYNRMTFNIQRHYDGGLIAESQRISSVNPDPVAFSSLVPADFKNGTSPQYQWQRSPNGSNQWVDVPGAIDDIYDVPAYLTDPSFVGVTYFRRKATNGVETYYSRNNVRLEICVVKQITDHQAFGLNEWIGYVYKGVDNFNEDDFQGRIRQEAEFVQQFPRPSDGKLLPQVWYPTLSEDGGCSFYTEEFTVRFKMEIWVDIGVYNFEVEGDDGFRLSVQNVKGEYLGEPSDGQYAIDDWNHGRERSKKITDDIEIHEPQVLRFVLEYYENINKNIISFKPIRDAFSILPLEWGELNAQACGSANCLTWETIQEKNTSHFELERSYNGIDWEMFDSSVLAQGTSTERVNYAFRDKLFTATKVYYRIRQVDLDGAFDYSEVLRVDNSQHAKGFLPFPNPTLEKILFYSHQEVVRLFITSNDLVLHTELKPEKLLDNRYEVNLSEYRPGTYVILVQTKDGGREVFKVIKK